MLPFDEDGAAVLAWLVKKLTGPFWIGLLALAGYAGVVVFETGNLYFAVRHAAKELANRLIVAPQSEAKEIDRFIDDVWTRSEIGIQRNELDLYWDDAGGVHLTIRPMMPVRLRLVDKLYWWTPEMKVSEQVQGGI